MKFIQLLLIQIIRLWFAVRPSLRKLVALVSLIQVLELLFLFLFLDFLDHLASLLRQVTEGLLFGVLVCLALFCG